MESSSLSEYMFSSYKKKLNEREKKEKQKDNALRCKSVRLSLRRFLELTGFTHFEMVGFKNKEVIIHWWMFIRGRNCSLVVRT